MQVLRFAAALGVFAASAVAVGAAAACGQSFTATGGDASTQEASTMPDAGDGAIPSEAAPPSDASADAGPDCGSPDAGPDKCLDYCRCLHPGGEKLFFDAVRVCQCTASGVNTMCTNNGSGVCGACPIGPDADAPKCERCLLGLSQVEPCLYTGLCMEAGAPVACVQYAECAFACPGQ